MSDRSKMSDRSTMSQRDRGMTLPELLISVVLTGLLVVAITASATVVLKTADNNEGRLNNARSEQNVNVWMPSDLTSAENVRTEPDLLPCGPQFGSTNTYAACPAGARSEQHLEHDAAHLVRFGRQRVERAGRHRDGRVVPLRRVRRRVGAAACQLRGHRDRPEHQHVRRVVVRVDDRAARHAGTAARRELGARHHVSGVGHQGHQRAGRGQRGERGRVGRRPGPHHQERQARARHDRRRRRRCRWWRRREDVQLQRRRHRPRDRPVDRRPHRRPHLHRRPHPLRWQLRPHRRPLGLDRHRLPERRAPASSTSSTRSPASR